MEPVGTINRQTILVVEDAPPIRYMVSQMLLQGGYEVVEAADGVCALQVLKNRNQPVDLVLTDMLMPRMGGAELAVHVFNLLPDTRVLFMSGYVEDPIVKALAAHPAILLHKPFTAGVLLGKVREVLDQPWPGVSDLVAGAT